jgi:hypothetical protein
MGCHKRRVNQEILGYYIENNDLDNVFSADVLIFEDEISSKMFDYYQKDVDICIIRKYFLSYGKGIEVITS